NNTPQWGWLGLILIVLFSLVLYLSVAPGCKRIGKFDVPGWFKQGDIVIGGIFPVYNREVVSIFNYEKKPTSVNCDRFDLRAFRWTQMMIFAIEEINKDPTILLNVTLGYRILDSCSSPTNTLRAALTLVGGQEENNSTCFPVSYFSTCACLSDRTKYPTFFRTVPSDYYQAKALAALVKRFGWKWIGALQADNDYGRNGIQAFTYSVDKTLRVLEMIKKSTVKVILAFTAEGDFYPLMKEVVKQNITGIQWIASEAWITSSRLSTPEMFQAFGGALGFVMPKMAVPNLKPFLTSISPHADSGAVFVRTFWEIIMGCTPHLSGENSTSSLDGMCTGDETLSDSQDPFFDVTELRVSYNVYNAIYAIAHALHRVVFCKSVGEKAEGPCMNVSQIEPKQVFFNIFFIFISFTSNLIPSGAVDCVPCPVKFWSSDKKDECIPKTVEYLTYNEPMGIVITVLSLLGASLCLITMVIFIKNNQTPVIKASNAQLSCFLLLSLVLCFLSPLTFIVTPTVWTCMLRHTAFGLTFAVCISCVLGKTIVVVLAFKATTPGSKVARQFGPKQQRIIVCACTFIQVVIIILWLTLNPPYPDMVFQHSTKKILLECNTGSEAAFYAVLSYIGFLAVICLVLAFIARKLPDNFNEAKFITFSLLIFCAVWISFIPAYVSSPGKFTTAVETFAILSSAFGLFICIFAPKCYIILIKPERNTKRLVAKH
uniref:G-protein coupled receptors family 3 profile domain-containing protein n=1 Tax=Cynoglossus semilaevis TaxID=244447 RepID=A0A3P8VXR5_CYNSE